MRRLVMVVCAALLFVPVILKSRTSQEIPAGAAFPVLSGARIKIKASGAVKHPGIYEVGANILATDAIKMAHPLSQVKLVAGAPKVLHNGATVELVADGESSDILVFGQMSAAERLVLGIPLDITTMSEADFDSLPGIGPALAKRICLYRQNNGGVLRVEELANVDGIGDKKYKMLRSYF